MEIAKTDKQLVWETLKYIEAHTIEPGQDFVILRETVWKDYTQEQVVRIRGIMLRDGIIQNHGTGYAFKLTPIGMVLKENDLNDDGTIKVKSSNKQYWLAFITTIAGVILGASASYIQDRAKEQFQLKHPMPILYRPTIQIVHDTIWIKK
jgi:hypothetical protein